MVGHKGWPGPENPVDYWVILENDKAVGFYEPSKGKAELLHKKNIFTPLYVEKTKSCFFGFDSNRKLDA